MRHQLVLTAITLSGLLAVCGPARAATRTSPIKPNYTSSPLIGTPSSNLVVDATGGTLATSDAHGHGMTYARLRPDIFPRAIAPGAIFVEVNSVPTQVDLASGTFTPLSFNMPHGGHAWILRAGRRWIEAREETPAHYYTVYIDRLTGQAASSEDFTAEQAPDLDSTEGPARPLCPGVRRVALAGKSDDGVADRYGKAFPSGNWVLEQISGARNTRSGGQVRRWQVQRCGSGFTALRFTAEGVPVLHAGRLAWADSKGVHLRQLATRHTKLLNLAELGDGADLAFSADSLLISSYVALNDAVDPEYATYRIPFR